MRRLVSLLLAVLMLSSLVPIASANDAKQITADLDGRPIAARDVSKYYCHDFDFPRIHCYLTGQGLNAALGAPQLSPMTAPPGTWVTVYSDATYAGNWFYLSHNYDNLGDIGWNDVISSFRVQVGFSGVFTQNAWGSGWQYNWCCYQTVPYVGSAYNDQFSSFYSN